MAWTGFLALPSYRGGKRGLCPVIFREIGKVHLPRTWPNLTLLDPFMGGGSVSLYAKAQGFQVLANDLARRCWIVGKGIVENNDRRLTDEDLTNIAEGEDGAGFAQANYVPHYFNTDQARMIDRALAYAQSVEDETRQALIYATAIRFINLIRIGGQISNQVLFRSLARGQFDVIQQPMLGCTTTKRFLTPAIKLLRRVQRDVNAGIFWGKAQAFQEDAMTFMKSHQADVVYLDPPYTGSGSYEANYYALDCLLEGRHLPKPRPSPFNLQQTAWHSLCLMFEAAQYIPTWVFSFSDTKDGFSAEQLCGLIEDFARNPRVVPLQHRWPITTTADQYQTGSQELLIIAT